MQETVDDELTPVKLRRSSVEGSLRPHIYPEKDLFMKSIFHASSRQWRKKLENIEPGNTRSQRTFRVTNIERQDRDMDPTQLAGWCCLISRRFFMYE